jgi:DNA-binding NarL/FixJ family response regulator
MSAAAKPTLSKCAVCGFAGCRFEMRVHTDELTDREREIVGGICQGASNETLGQMFGISENTARNHLHAIFVKLQLGDRLELALYALHHNLHRKASMSGETTHKGEASL